MIPCRIYANLQHLVAVPDPQLNDLCLALWHQGTPEAHLIHGTTGVQFESVSSPDQADLWVLPLWWNEYLERGLISLAREEAACAARFNHRLVVFSRGDFTASLPFGSSILFERCTYASRRTRHGNYVHALPVFTSDYTRKYCNGELRLREKGDTPVVGFCGQAGGTWLDFTRRELASQFRKLSYAMHLRKWEPAPFETTRLRRRVLALLADHPGVQSNFLIRQRYRAGYWKDVKDPFHPTRLEFVHNILDSDYTICMRGGGNFSVRFYETLALGRIPVFVNTDCLLPYDQLIKYRDYVVWVEQSEISRIGEKILAFHEALTPVQFKDLQMACYNQWQEWLSMKGFYQHFLEHRLDGPLDVL